MPVPPLATTCSFQATLEASNWTQSSREKHLLELRYEAERHPRRVTSTSLNTMLSTVTVHYPFHPLHDRRLEIVSWPRRIHKAVTVRHPDGKSLKIPLWMRQPDAVAKAKTLEFCWQLVGGRHPGPLQ